MKSHSIQIVYKNKQQFFLSQEIQKALHVLQMPVLELATWIDEIIEQNPLLEKEEDSKSYGPDQKDPLVELFSSPPSLFEHLMEQAQLTFRGEDLFYAEVVIGSLDHRGYLLLSLEELAKQDTLCLDKLERVIKKIQDFDPPGIASRTLQDCFLSQLKHQKDSLAYTIIKEHFHDFLHHRFLVLQKKLKCSVEELDKAIYGTIRKLSSRPAAKFDNPVTSIVHPDVFLEKVNGQWKIEVNTKPLPTFTTSSHVSHVKELRGEEKKVMEGFISSAQSLQKILQKRHSTLKKITECLLEKHLSFFEEETRFLEPLRMSEVAKMVELHESTVARAISNKYLSTPLGTFSFKYFLNCPLKSSSDKEISAKTAKDLIAHMILQEDKKNPLSDLLISHQLKKKGISCARRTVAKYREQLKHPPAHQRKSL